MKRLRLQDCDVQKSLRRAQRKSASSISILGIGLVRKQQTILRRLSNSAILRSMQSLAERAGSTTSQNFAGLLAAFARQTPKSPDDFKDEQLSDDVVSLSYERALRTHARYKAPHSIESQPAQAQPAAVRAAAFSPEDDCAEDETPPVAAAPEGHIAAITSSDADHEKNLKCASITIRVSKDECAQLHQRAAEAGLTVSAYLRSCTFEAETLRALVKEAMAHLKVNPTAEKPEQEKKGRRCWFGWLRWFWPQGRAQRRAVEA